MIRVPPVCTLTDTLFPDTTLFRSFPSPIRVISIDFREEGPNGLRFNSFAGKRARGMMARYMCEHHLSEPESLKSFDSDGYVHDPDGSEENIRRLVRR